MINRTLYDVTQLLESADDADSRVRRVLVLLRGLVPYEQCAMLEARLGHEPHVVLVPGAPAAEGALLTATLLDIFGQLVDVNPPAGTATAPLPGVHLAVPLVGLDEVIGVLLVRSSVGGYTEVHLRTLSVVAAALAAYLTMLRGRAELGELAQQRDHAREAAEAGNRARDEFLALVSRELQTPLTSIRAWAHVLSSTTDEAERARALDGIEQNIQAQAKLIADILDLSCIASAERQLNLRSIEPALLIDATLAGLRLEAERKSIRIDADLDVATMPLVLDRERMGQAIAILVANAINFTPAGGHIEVRLQRAAGYARIQVIDGASNINRVGLAAVTNLVELHGGRLRVESTGSELGTTFTVDLPRVPGRGPLASGNRVGRERLAGIRVLLVDHDLGLCESFRTVLEQYGAEVAAVASAPEALEALERSRPDVLLFGDLAIRGESADTLMHEVTAQAAPVPIASISAWRLEERHRELGTKFQLHIAKPLEIGKLIDAVARLAGRPQ